MLPHLRAEPTVHAPELHISTVLQQMTVADPSVALHYRTSPQSTLELTADPILAGSFTSQPGAAETRPARRDKAHTA